MTQPQSMMTTPQSITQPQSKVTMTPDFPLGVMGLELCVGLSGEVIIFDRKGNDVTHEVVEQPATVSHERGISTPDYERGINADDPKKINIPYRELERHYRPEFLAKAMKKIPQGKVLRSNTQKGDPKSRPRAASLSPPENVVMKRYAAYGELVDPKVMLRDHPAYDLKYGFMHETGVAQNPMGKTYVLRPESVYRQKNSEILESVKDIPREMVLPEHDSRYYAPYMPYTQMRRTVQLMYKTLMDLVGKTKEYERQRFFKKTADRVKRYALPDIKMTEVREILFKELTEKDVFLYYFLSLRCIDGETRRTQLPRHPETLEAFKERVPSVGELAQELGWGIRKTTESLRLLMMYGLVRPSRVYKTGTVNDKTTMNGPNGGTTVQLKGYYEPNYYWEQSFPLLFYRYIPDAMRAETAPLLTPKFVPSLKGRNRVGRHDMKYRGSPKLADHDILRVISQYAFMYRRKNGEKLFETPHGVDTESDVADEYVEKIPKKEILEFARPIIRNAPDPISQLSVFTPVAVQALEFGKADTSFDRMYMLAFGDGLHSHHINI